MYQLSCILLDFEWSSPSVRCLFVFFFFLNFFYCFQEKKIKKKKRCGGNFEKYKNSLFLCILVLVYLGWPMKHCFMLCTFCSLDKHLHAQLEILSFVAHYMIRVYKLIILTHIYTTYIDRNDKKFLRKKYK